MRKPTLDVVEWTDGVWLSPDGASRHYTVGATPPPPAPAPAAMEPVPVWARIPAGLWGVVVLVAGSGLLSTLAGR